MLKLLEGSVVNVPPEGGRKHPEQKLISVNTRQILFVCAGAFDGIEKRIAKRLNTRMVGYTSSQNLKQIKPDDLLQYVTHQDLKSYGLIPEIIGRLPILTYLEPLDRNTLRKILTEPKNAITRQYSKLLEMDSISLEFDDEALDFIVDKAMEEKLGARGLRGIVETVMIDSMFNLPGGRKKELRVTRTFVEREYLRNRK